MSTPCNSIRIVYTTIYTPPNLYINIPGIISRNNVPLIKTYHDLQTYGKHGLFCAKTGCKQLIDYVQPSFPPYVRTLQEPWCQWTQHWLWCKCYCLLKITFAVSVVTRAKRKTCWRKCMHILVDRFPTMHEIVTRLIEMWCHFWHVCISCNHAQVNE